MPGFLLHAGAQVVCSHQGQAQPASVNPRVSVSNQAIVTQNNAYAITGVCSLSSTGSSPCVTATWITAAMRVTSMGSPVLLLDSQSKCIPTGTPLLVTATQTRVSAM